MTFLIPFITTLMAWVFLDEIPSMAAFVGGALCIAGVLPHPQEGCRQADTWRSSY